MYKKMQDEHSTFADSEVLESHTNNKDNPHKVTKAQVGLSNVINTRQINAISTPVTNGNIPVFDGNGWTLKDSGFTVQKSVPADANFNDTVYTHPTSGILPGTYTRVTTDSNGHITYGDNPVTLKEYGFTDAVSGVKGDAETDFRVGQVNLTKENIGLGNVENKSSLTIRSEITKANIISSLGYTPEIEGAYENSTAYTDKKFEELTGTTSETLENINKLSTEIENNQNLIDMLSNSITSKASQAELNTHVNNGYIHVTATDKQNFSNFLTHIESPHARVDATKVESSSTNGNILINGVQTQVYAHPSGTNPHGTTKSDVGLNNVPNVPTNDQTPTYTESDTLTNLTSGEKISVAFGKMAKAVSSFISHLNLKSALDKIGHVKPDNITTSVTSDGTISAKLKGCIVGQRGGTITNPYYKFASCRCPIPGYSDYDITFKVSSGFINRQIFGMLHIDIRTEGTVFGSSSRMEWEYANNNIDTSKFFIVYKAFENYIDVQLWTKIDSAYTMYFFDVIQETDIAERINTWTLYSKTGTGSDASLPEGYTAVTSVLADIQNRASFPLTANLLATVPGTALDATMGKALNDSITAINSRFLRKTLTITVLNGMTGQVNFKKIGNTVTLNIEAWLSADMESYRIMEIATVTDPEFIPCENIIAAAVWTDRYLSPFYTGIASIYTNGVISVRTSTRCNNTNRFICSMTYFSN